MSASPSSNALPAASSSAAGLSRVSVTAGRHIGAQAIRRGLILNLLGTLVPIAVALWCVREIVGRLGSARFGTLTLAWTFINAVGILDLGIGRALTRFLAVQEDRDEEHEGAVVWTSLAALLGMGVVGGIITWELADLLAGSVTRGAAALRHETGTVFRLLATSIPLVILSSGLRGILEAFGRFDLTNRVTIPISLLNLICPVALLRLGATLPSVVLALVLLRLSGTLLLGRFVLLVIPAMRGPRLCIDGVRSVLAFGGWVTVSNIPGPLFAQAERFLLGTFTALSSVAFYSTPADLLTRITVIPSAALQVTFPVLAQSFAADPTRAARVANRTLFFIAAGVLAPLTLLVAIAPEALQRWLGPEFASHSARAGRILAVAIFVNCMAWLPFSLVQSAGRARWTGKLHAIEIPLYLALVAFAISRGGVVGAAIANLSRAAIDSAVVVSMAARILGPSERLGRRYALLVGGGVAVLVGASAPVPLTVRLGWSLLATAVAAALAWRHGLDAEAREAISARAAALWIRKGRTAP